MLNYKGLRATLERLIVSDAQVDRQIDQLLEQNQKTIVITDRPAQADDEVVLDYIGYCDGVPFEGGAAQNQALVLGSGMFIPGFEEQLIGKNAGDEVEVRVTFPDGYHAAALAGKAAVFKCTVREIHFRRKYAADDEFARDVGGYDTFEAFRAALRDGMQAYADQQADRELKDRLMDQLCDACACEITEAQLQRAIDLEMQNLEAQLGRQRLSLDLYCQFTGKTREQLREECIPDARKSIKRQYIIAEIAEAEGIEADETSVAEEISRICQENGMTMETLQPHMDSAFENAVIRSVIANKVLDRIKDSAVIQTVVKQPV